MYVVNAATFIQGGKLFNYSRKYGIYFRASEAIGNDFSLVKWQQLPSQ